MAKSNMKSVNIRKHHRRIQHQAQVDSHNRRERMYKQKEHHPAITTLHLTVLLTMVQRLSKWFSNIDPFNWLEAIMGGNTRLGNLDLTKDSVFETGQRRDAGAQYLRSMWPGLGNMVSTRDGKIIQ